MMQVIKNSLIFVVFEKVKCIYMDSRLAKVVSAIRAVYEQSRVSSTVKKYKHRESSMNYSQAVRCFQGIFGFFDRLIGKLAELCSKGKAVSLSLKLYQSAKESLQNRPVAVFFCCLIFFMIGTLSLFLFRKVFVLNEFLIAVGIWSLVLLFICSHGFWKNALKFSIVFRMYQWIRK